MFGLATLRDLIALRVRVEKLEQESATQQAEVDVLRKAVNDLQNPPVNPAA